MYFIHGIFEDFTDKVIIGFSREQAQALMGGLDANMFMNEIRRDFKSDMDFESWLNENLLFKTFKILVKSKQETFKGESRQRFYALDVSQVPVTEDDDHDNRVEKPGNINNVIV